MQHGSDWSSPISGLTLTIFPQFPSGNLYGSVGPFLENVLLSVGSMSILWASWLLDPSSEDLEAASGRLGRGRNVAFDRLCG